MEQQHVTATAPQKASPKTKKRAYSPPKAILAPLKLEERLSWSGSGCDPTTCTEGSYIK